LTGGDDEIKPLTVRGAETAEKTERFEVTTRTIIFMCDHQGGDGLRHALFIPQQGDDEL
jgi:hypothetical protein